MKLLGANDDMNGGRGPSSHRSQDDAAVGYVFQRHPHETADFPHFSHKQAPQQPRWASGDETIIDVSTHLHLILFFLLIAYFVVGSLLHSMCFHWCSFLSDFNRCGRQVNSNYFTKVYYFHAVNAHLSLSLSIFHCLSVCANIFDSNYNPLQLFSASYSLSTEILIKFMFYMFPTIFARFIF